MTRQLWVIEFQDQKLEWDWFFGYDTKVEAQADLARFGKTQLCDGTWRKARITHWREV